VWVGTATATEEGTATLTFTVPADTPAGMHHLEMRGITSGHVATSPTFEVLAAAAVPVSGTLPYTGGDVLPLGIAAVVMFALGAVVVLGTRRRTATVSEG
jgi:arabinogalactan endo-1,4-beta-galactosidase